MFFVFVFVFWFARAALAACDRHGAGCVVAVLAALGCVALDIQREVDRNTPLCRVVGGRLEGLQVVTKGGALGFVFVTCDLGVYMFKYK